jgi:hypothetical protein
VAAVVTHKADGVSTSNAFATPSQSWTAGSRGLVSVATANTGGSVQGHSCTGGGVTWIEVDSLEYGGRRGACMFHSDGTPSTGALTITATVNGTYQETQWSIDEVTGQDGTTPFDTGQSAAASSGTSLNCPDVGTIDAGDVVYAMAAFESGADSFAWAAGVTSLVYRSGGGNVRSLRTGHSSTDDTPGVTWGTSGNGAAIIAVIINAAAGGGGDRTVDATTQNLTLTGQAATVRRHRAVNATTQALTLTAHTATVLRNRTVPATTQALTLTAHAATVRRNRSVQGTTAALTLTAQPATVLRGGARTVLATTATLTFTGHPATIIRGGEVAAPRPAGGGFPMIRQPVYDRRLEQVEEILEDVEQAATDADVTAPEINAARIELQRIAADARKRAASEEARAQAEKAVATRLDAVEDALLAILENLLTKISRKQKPRTGRGS